MNKWFGFVWKSGKSSFSHKKNIYLHDYLLLNAEIVFEKTTGY